VNPPFVRDVQRSHQERKPGSLINGLNLALARSIKELGDGNLLNAVLAQRHQGRDLVRQVLRESARKGVEYLVELLSCEGRARGRAQVLVEFGEAVAELLVLGDVRLH